MLRNVEALPYYGFQAGNRRGCVTRACPIIPFLCVNHLNLLVYEAKIYVFVCVCVCCTTCC